MTWSAGEDRFTLSGTEGLLCFTTTRRRALPPGEAGAKELRSAAASGSSPVPPRAVIGMQQVHGARIAVVEQERDAVLAGCDGLVTDRAGIALAVRTADCLPLVLFDPSRRVLGAAHAGWRGLKAGIAGRLAQTVGPGELWAAVGPGIGPCCYAVGPEFEGWFPGHLKDGARGRCLDLAGVAAAQLREAGVPPERIFAAPWCSSCERDLCSSYRREGQSAGRMVTCAMMV